MKPLHIRLLEELRKQADAEWEYINPHFLAEIATAIDNYYNVEDVVVDKWIDGMWGA